MRKTKAQKYNDRMDEIFASEIKRMKKLEEIAKDILNNLKCIGDFNTHGFNENHLINIIARTIRTHIIN